MPFMQRPRKQSRRLCTAALRSLSRQLRSRVYVYTPTQQCGRCTSILCEGRDLLPVETAFQACSRWHAVRAIYCCTTTA